VGRRGWVWLTCKRPQAWKKAWSRYPGRIRQLWRVASRWTILSKTRKILIKKVCLLCRQVYAGLLLCLRLTTSHIVLNRKRPVARPSRSDWRIRAFTVAKCQRGICRLPQKYWSVDPNSIIVESSMDKWKKRPKVASCRLSPSFIITRVSLPDPAFWAAGIVVLAYNYFQHISYTSLQLLMVINILWCHSTYLTGVWAIMIADQFRQARRNFFGPRREMIALISWWLILWVFMSWNEEFLVSLLKLLLKIGLQIS
jgi:hypothetical protein